jgi:transcriptional regulator with XRE-family HTH domain
MKFKKPKDNDGETFSSEFIKQALLDKGMSIKDLSEKLELSYEHTRRLTNGLTIPSKFVLRALCSILDLNEQDMEKLVTVDKIRKRYGSIPAEIAGKKPGLEPIERVWDRLTPDQQGDAVAMIVGWARRNGTVLDPHRES